MSKIGEKPVKIPEKVEVKITNDSDLGGQKVSVSGPLGQLEEHFRRGVVCKLEEGEVVVERKEDTKPIKSLHGLYRTIIENMITGVTKGYEKDLEMVGIGYRAELKGDVLELSADATHPYEYKAPEGISFEVNDKVNIKIKGIDKQLVGQVAARIRAFSRPEPYKGKGIRYKDEYIRRKAGKAAKAEEGAE